MDGSLERSVKPIPEIKLLFNIDSQQVDLKFDPAEFKTWEWVIACLDMAKMKAAHMRELQLQQAAMAQSQREFLARKKVEDFRGKIIH